MAAYRQEMDEADTEAGQDLAPDIPHAGCFLFESRVKSAHAESRDI
jgi:hypothetical protein